MTNPPNFNNPPPLGTAALQHYAAVAHEAIHRGDPCPACDSRWVDGELVHADDCHYNLALDMLEERGLG